MNSSEQEVNDTEVPADQNANDSPQEQTEPQQETEGQGITEEGQTETAEVERNVNDEQTAEGDDAAAVEQDATPADGIEKNEENGAADTTNIDEETAEDKEDNAADSTEVKDDNAADSTEVKDDNAADSTEVKDDNAADSTEAKDDNAADSTEVKDDNAADSTEVKDDNAADSTEVKDDNAADSTEVKDDNAADSTEVKDDNAADSTEAKDDNAADSTEVKDDTVADSTEIKDATVADGTEIKDDGAKQHEETAVDNTVAEIEQTGGEPAPEGELEQKEDGDNTAEQEEGTKQDKEEVPTAEKAASSEIHPEEAEAGTKQGEDTARIEEKGTPEPSTEHMASGTDKAGEGLGPAGRPVAEKHAAPSPVPQYDADATATVKFVLLPTQQVATLRCYLTQTLYDLKEHFAQELKIPASSILFMLDGKGTEDRMTLGELGVGPNGTIRLEMQSADPENQPIKAFKPRQEYTMPDVISVRVSSENGMKDVVVEIERANRKKPFLGGYRHKKTGVEYHHASAQTIQKPRPPPAVERFCRDTQTVKQKHIQQQTTNDMATQMTKIGVYVNNMQDKVIIPGKYLTADEFRMNTLQQVIIIQKYYRRWLAKRYVEKVRMDQARRLEWERKEELRKKKEKEDRIRREFERRMNPKTKEDFDLLYHALEKWRQEEMNHINETLTGAERKAALCQLLDQETQLIASIGRHKLEANDENRQKAIQALLEKASSPKRWKGPDGKLTEMDTPYTIRAQELRDIYNSINMKYLTQDERLDVLLTLKHTVKEHDCKLTQEIIELIDREADLLMRGVKESNLEGLRRRISSLFLQYIKTPTFNPEAARLLKVPQDPSTLRNNIYYCTSCSQYLPSTEFQLSSNSRVVGKCRKCNKMDNDARVRQDYSHYRYMLKSIRREEESYDDDSKIAFLMQENDLRYLVENIWNSQSILSAWDDLYDLVLVRWDRHQEWSPWNSILLTKEEATAHKKLERLEEAYGKVFLHKVKHKHTLARNYFSRMPGMAEHMRGRKNSALTNGPTVSGKAISPTKA